MKLSIIGTGYVGLVTGTCFAEVGHHVICVDNDAAKVKMLQAGGIPIYEPGLEELVKKNVAAGRLKFTNSTAEGVQNSDVIFIAVPTPPQPDGSVDLSYIERVARDIAAAMTEYKIVVDKSTVPVKTAVPVTIRALVRICSPLPARARAEGPAGVQFPPVPPSASPDVATAGNSPSGCILIVDLLGRRILSRVRVNGSLRSMGSVSVRT